MNFNFRKLKSHNKVNHQKNEEKENEKESSDKNENDKSSNNRINRYKLKKKKKNRKSLFEQKSNLLKMKYAKPTLLKRVIRIVLTKISRFRFVIFFLFNSY